LQPVKGYRYRRIILLCRNILASENDRPQSYNLHIKRYQSKFIEELEEVVMGKSLNKEKLEEFIDANRKIQEEIHYWR